MLQTVTFRLPFHRNFKELRSALSNIRNIGAKFSVNIESYDRTKLTPIS